MYCVSQSRHYEVGISREVRLAALVPYSEALRLDAELVRIARGASALRLAVGEALDALSSSGGHHELGFSSLEAYARERCERTGRWAADTRALARKLGSLPRMREELRSGNIGWSTAELLARHVSTESELAWLERARGATVRELRALLAESAPPARPVPKADDDHEDEPLCTLTVTATREDGWLFEGARKVAEAVAGPMSAERLLQCLLAEGLSTLLELVPDAQRSGLYEIEELERDVDASLKAHAKWCAERQRWQNEAEELCATLLSLVAVVAPVHARCARCPPNARRARLKLSIGKSCVFAANCQGAISHSESSQRARERPKSGGASALRPKLNMRASDSAFRCRHSSPSGFWQRARGVCPSLLALSRAGGSATKRRICFRAW
jgi:hypothetical protein